MDDRVAIERSGQMLIAADGPDAAIAETYMTAMHIVPPGYPLSTVFPDRGEDYSAVIAGRYVDRLVLYRGGWRIMQRTGIYDQDAAERHWQRLFSLFGRTLAPR